MIATINDSLYLSGTIYKGYYVLGPDNRYYTGQTYIYGISLLLIDNTVYPDNNPGLTTYYPNPTVSLYNSSFMTRYFVRNIIDNNSTIILVNKLQYNIIVSPLYKKASLDWYINGTSKLEVQTKNTNMLNTFISLNNIFSNIKELILINPVLFYREHNILVNNQHPYYANIALNTYVQYNKLGFDLVPGNTNIALDQESSSFNLYSLIHTKHTISDFSTVDPL